MKNKNIKLHLGCGTKIFNGWVNVDLLDLPGVDLIEDVTKLTSVSDGTVSEIYACHVLEHIRRDQLVPTLQLWHRKLLPGGKLKIAVPDFEAVCNVYLKNRSIQEVIGLVSGGREGILDEHKIIFDYEYLAKQLNLCGYTKVSRYAWQETDHAVIDDYSQAYLPHMDKEDGTLMSLNVIAFKEEI